MSVHWRYWCPYGCGKSIACIKNGGRMGTNLYMCSRCQRVYKKAGGERQRKEFSLVELDELDELDAMTTHAKA